MIISWWGHKTPEPEVLSASGMVKKHGSAIDAVIHERLGPLPLGDGLWLVEQALRELCIEARK